MASATSADFSTAELMAVPKSWTICLASSLISKIFLSCAFVLNRIALFEFALMLSDPQGCGQLANMKETNEQENQTSSLFQIISEAGFGVEPNGTRSHAIPCTGL